MSKLHLLNLSEDHAAEILELMEGMEPTEVIEALEDYQ